MAEGARTAFRLLCPHEVLSDLPEHAHMRGVEGGYSRRAGKPSIDSCRGMLHGLHVAVGEENLLRQASSARLHQP